MRKQSIFQQFLVVGGSAIISMFVGLLTTPLITRLVDPVQYGQATIFGTYASIALMVLSLGMDQALMRYYYREDHLDYQKKLLLRCWMLPIALSALMFSVLYYAAAKSYFEVNRGMLLHFILYVIILILNRFSILLLRLTKETNLYSFLTILQKIVYVSVALGTIKILQGDPYHLLVLANISAYLLVTVIAIYSERKLWNPIGLHGTISVSTREMVKYGFPLMIANGIYVVFQAIDKLSLNHFCSYAEVGVYSSAMSLLSVTAVLSSTFNTIWAPASVEHYENSPEDKFFFIKGNQYITVIMFAFGLTLVLCKDLIVLLLGEKYREASFILPFLLLQPIMYTISETTVVGIYFKKKSYASLIVSFGSCLVNLIGNFVLIPIIGPKGAAISTGISYVVFFALRTSFSNYFYHVNFSLGRFTVITIVTLLFLAYNTWFDFGAITVALYLVSMIILYLLYKRSVGELAEIVVKKLEAMKQSINGC